MTDITRPMLAATVTHETLHKVEWPALCSPKVDGIRVLIHPTLGPVTRSFKPLPNHYVREELMRHVSNSYLDGELIAVDKDDQDLSFNMTQSALMSRDGQPRFKYLVFDCFERPDWDFETRYHHTRHICAKVGWPRLRVLEHVEVKDLDEFVKFTDRVIRAGFEGAIIRAPSGIYKNGRSTLKQGWLLKYKEWLDAEGTVTGFVELMHNSNADIKDEFGLAKRSSAKDGMVPMGTLGALEVMTEWGKVYLGSGFDQTQRQTIWNRNMVMQTSATEWVVRGPQPDMGRQVVFKYQPFGMQDLPRFPIFKGFRETE